MACCKFQRRLLACASMPRTWDDAFREAFAVVIGTVLSFTDDEAKRKAAINVLNRAHRRV
jgi:hypothetical protein